MSLFRPSAVVVFAGLGLLAMPMKAPAGPKEDHARLNAFNTEFERAGLAKDWPRALSAADKMIGLAPGNSTGYIARAIALQNQERWDESAIAVEKGLRLGNNTWHAHSAYAAVLQHQGRYSDAITSADRALNIKPKAPRPLLVRAYCNQKLGREEIAIADLSLILKLEPHQSQVRTYRGKAYARLRRLPEAIADFSAVIKQEPKNGRAYAERAVAFTHLEQYEAAEADFERAAQFGEEEAFLVKSRGMIELNQRRVERALPALERARELLPDDPEVTLMLAKALAAPSPVRNPERALELAQEALKICGDDWRHLGNLALAFAWAGDLEGAIRAQRRCLIDCHAQKLPAERIAIAEAQLKEWEKKQAEKGRQ